MEPLSGRVDMTFKSTDGRKTTAGSLLGRRFEDFKVGDIVFGTIKRIESFGLFVSIEHSSVVSSFLLNFLKFSVHHCLQRNSHKYLLCRSEEVISMRSYQSYVAYITVSAVCICTVEIDPINICLTM